MLKKMLALFLCLAVLFSFAACDKEKENSITDSISGKLTQISMNTIDAVQASAQPAQTNPSGKTEKPHKDEDTNDPIIEPGDFDDNLDNAMYLYSMQLCDVWVHRSYDDEVYILAIDEAGNLYTDLLEFYESDMDTVSPYTWGVTLDKALVEEYREKSMDHYVNVDEGVGESIVYFKLPSLYSDDKEVIETCPVEISLNSNVMRVFRNDGSTQAFYRSNSIQAGFMLRDSSYYSLLNPPRFGYLTIDSDVDDEFFRINLKEMLWIGWNHFELMQQYGIDPDDMTNDYMLWDTGITSSFLLPKNDDVSYWVIDWDDYVGLNNTQVDYDEFIDLVSQYSQYSEGMLVSIDTYEDAVYNISEVYVP